MQVVIGVITVLLCSLCSLSSAQVNLRTCGDEQSDITCPFFFDKVNEAFRKPSILYTLRKAFYPTAGAPPTLFDIFMTLEIESSPKIKCTSIAYEFGKTPVTTPPTMEEVCNKYKCESYNLTWQHQWSKTILATFIQQEDLELLQNTNIIAFSAGMFNSFDTNVFSKEEEGLKTNTTKDNKTVSQTERGSVQFVLTVDFLPCQPDELVLQRVWEDILIWMQLYAMNSDNLENVEYNQEGRGFAFREGINRQQGFTVPIITIIHVLLNIVFALASTYTVFTYNCEFSSVTGKRYQILASMYWSLVFMCFAGAVIIIAGNGYLYYALILLGDESLSVFSFRIASDSTIGILAIIQFIVAMLTPHDPEFFIPGLLRRVLSCNNCCRGCGSQTRLDLLHRFILGCAMWIIIVFLQLLISTLIPLAAVVFTNPVPSLAFVSIVISLFCCTVIFVAYFLNAFEGNYIARHKLSPEERRKFDTAHSLGEAGITPQRRMFLIAQGLIFIVIFVIVVLVVILYLNFVRAGANTNTVSGFFFSIVPSAALGLITWAAKKHLFKDLEEEEEEEDKGEGGNDSKDVVKDDEIKVGSFSFNRDQWRPSVKKRPKKRNANGHSASTPSIKYAHTNGTVNTSNGFGHNTDTVIEMQTNGTSNGTSNF